MFGSTFIGPRLQGFGDVPGTIDFGAPPRAPESRPGVVAAIALASCNDDAYNLTPAFILETVAAAKGFIVGPNKGNVPLITGRKGPDLDVTIGKFLAWPPDRVKSALAQLSAIEEGELSKKAVESLPTIPARVGINRENKVGQKTRKEITSDALNAPPGWCVFRRWA